MYDVGNSYRRRGFTIVELLIVIVIVGVLAALVIIAYNGIQNRSSNARVQSEVTQVKKMVEAYAANASDGQYPSTGGLNTVRSDANCPVGSHQTDWVPAVDSSRLPQSQQPFKGAQDQTGCFLYASDGTSYFISAWNMVKGGPNTSAFYRRLGGREYGFMNSNAYLCNHAYIGGVRTGVYSATLDYYKYSYTTSNITNCNETPPSGA